MTAVTLSPAALQELLAILERRGYTIIGPSVQERAVVLDRLSSIDQLPQGWHDRQAPGFYAVDRCAATGFFAHACGPQSWKRFLYPPDGLLFRASLAHPHPRLETVQPPAGPYAFLGIRACDLKALEILDRVLMASNCPDPYYAAVRRRLLIIAVDCTIPGGTCFCATMQAGPRVVSAHDIRLNELGAPQRHRLIAEPGSREGADLLQALPSRPSAADDLAHLRRLAEAATERMKTRVLPSGVAALFGDRFDHPHWQTLDERCLACGNCTLVCPTCFCHCVSEVECLEDGLAERRRQWDSCFNRAFSYIHGGSLRPRIAARYRQWLCHKLSTWPMQFGTPGCVGCGRCRTWCPAGIDLLEEASRLAGDPSSDPNRNEDVHERHY